jgi:hypothetical protein
VNMYYTRAFIYGFMRYKRAIYTTSNQIASYARDEGAKDLHSMQHLVYL